MFERFTDRARQVVVDAKGEAHRLGDGYIGTEHLLLALLRNPSDPAARVVTALGVDCNELRERLAIAVPPGTSRPYPSPGDADPAGTGPRAPLPQTPFAPDAKQALAQSLREALQLNHRVIDVVHVFLGVLAQREGVAARVLKEAGVDLAGAHGEAIRMVRDGERIAGAPDQVRPPVPPPPPAGGDPPGRDPRRAHQFGAPPLLGFGQVPQDPGWVAATVGDRPPKLLRVIGLGRVTLSLPGQGTLTPLSLTVWSTCVELRYVVTGPDAHLDAADLHVTDDLGTGYTVATATSTTASGLVLGTLCLVPGPPPAAREFTVAVPDGAALHVRLVDGGEPGGMENEADGTG